MQVSVHLPVDGGLSGVVLRWLRVAGQPVVQGEPLAQAVVGGRPVLVHSPCSGTLQAIHVAAGQGIVTPAAVATVQLLPQGPASEVIPWSPLRRNMAEHMAISDRSIVHLTVYHEVDMAPLVECRHRLTEGAKQQLGFPLGFAPFFVRGAAKLLAAYPRLNAQITPQGMLLQREVHVGVMVAVPGGLRAPKIMHADRKSLQQIAVEMNSLAEQSRAGTIWPAQEQGATFSVSSAGAKGPVFATPIIPYPNVATLGCNRITERPLALQGHVVVRPAMFMNLTVDHRLVDGQEAAEFLHDLGTLLGAPEQLLGT